MFLLAFILAYAGSGRRRGKFGFINLMRSNNLNLIGFTQFYIFLREKKTANLFPRWWFPMISFFTERFSFNNQNLNYFSFLIFYISITLYSKLSPITITPITLTYINYYFNYLFVHFKKVFAIKKITRRFLLQKEYFLI